MSFVFLLLLITAFQVLHAATNDGERILNWSNKIGEKLWKLGRTVTYSLELKADYSSVNVTEVNIKELIKEMTVQMKDMLDLKKYALRRIVDVAEEFTKNLSDKLNETEKFAFEFKEAKDLKSTKEEQDQMKANVNFFDKEVSINFSTVHVPDDVYKKANETFLGIKWSEILDEHFRHNYATDPTLSWQYFAGASGYMRIYPGVRWEVESDKADLYDARSRPWYVEAATDPKDVIILVDNSGSMMGQKREIARHTINTILETLGPNDFVNIIQFCNEITPVVGCFSDNLVQANLVTIRELKLGVENMTNATSLANFTEALQRAFTILENHRKDYLASMCNQAIMLITDGVPDSNINIFRKYNWKNSTETPFPVRVFTYLIGRDGADFRDTKWMACANKGYYAQLNTIPEVKEHVLNYIHVLARPLVLKKSRKIAWTSLYAHQVDSKLTDRYWANEQDKQQRDYTSAYRKDWDTFLRPENQLKRLKERRKMELSQNNNFGYEKYNLMVTISHPAYDRRATKVFDAALLGVAATDIPISELKKIMNPHLLGVNNYGFIVNNNGYIITHPDLRPVFGETLKPGYNTVDMLEVEILDSDLNVEPRDFGIQVLMTMHGEPIYSLSNLSLLRDYIINQSDYSNSYAIKYHYDNMRRASTGIRHYTVRKIEDSPFTMVLAFVKQPCKGFANCPPVRILASPFEERLTHKKINELFSENWNVHPDWFYCKYNYKNQYYQSWADKSIVDKRTELIHFLRKFSDDLPSQFSKNRYADFKKDATKKNENFQLLSYFCDKELIDNIVHDANITNKYFSSIGSTKDVINASTDINFSVANVFISTHSGLTRWKDFGSRRTSFGYIYNRSIDEVWYKRAVEQHYFEEESFVFSVPFKEDSAENELAIASHAIFVKERKRGKVEETLEAPIAVVGYQFDQVELEKFIRNIVHESNRKHDDSIDDVNYVVLDNNGYIVASSKTGYSGKFFGTIQSGIMKQFKECNVYKQIIIYDYQGVCFQRFHDLTNSGISILINPIVKHIDTWLKWTYYTFLWGIVQINIEMMVSILTYPNNCAAELSIIKGSPYTNIDEVPVLEDKLDHKLLETFEYFNKSAYEGESPKYVSVRHLVKINRTRPKTCDRKTVLYQLEPAVKWDNKSLMCSQVVSLIRVIPHTNLLFVLLKNGFEEDIVDYQYFTTYPTKVKPKFSNSSVCYKVNAVLSRRRPSSCCKHHKNESDIKICGSGNRLRFSITCFISSSLWYLINAIQF